MEHLSISNRSGESGGTLNCQSSFTEMTERFYGRIYFTALAIVRHPDTAQDIAQETFLRAWLKRDTITAPALHLQPWLIRIASNLALQWLRSGQQRSRLLPLIPLEDSTVEPVDELTPNGRQTAGRIEERSQLVEAVLDLPTEMRQAVLLHYGEGLSASDIARMNGEAPSTVTRRLNQAMKQLRGRLESEFVTGLAMLKPGRHHMERVFLAATAVSSLPANTRAQLAQMASDTPPFTAVIPSVRGRAWNPPKILSGNTVALKLVAGVMCAAALVAATVGLKGLAFNEKGSELSALSEKRTSESNQTAITAMDGRKVPQSKSRRDPKGATFKVASVPVPNGRSSISDRISALEDDPVSSAPEIIQMAGETTKSISLNLQVVNGSGLPVEGATVSIPEYGFDITGQQYMGGKVTLAKNDVPVFLTNQQGVARVLVPTGPTEYSGDPKTDNVFITSRMTAEVSHPDYASLKKELEFSKITKLVMTAGNILELVPIDSRTSVPILSNVEVEDRASFSPEKELRSDGKILLRRIADNRMVFVLKHRDQDGQLLISDVETVNFPLANNEPVTVALYPAETFRGRLDESVPRPISDITVMAKCTRKYNMGETSCTVPVAPDGTFVIPDVPRNSKIKVAAIGQGYCSKLLITNKGAISLPSLMFEEIEQPYILPMVKTATARLRIVSPDGSPVSSATVSMIMAFSYNEFNLPDHLRDKVMFRGITGSDGVAVIENLPPMIAAPVQLKHPQFAFPQRETVTTLSDGGISKSYSPFTAIDLAPGEVHEETLATIAKPLEPAGEKRSRLELKEGATLTYSTTYSQ